MKVLLVYPYFATGKNQDPLFHPLGISVLAAKVKDLGMQVKTLDCTFLTMEDVMVVAEDYHADINGIYVMTTMSQNAFLLLDQFRLTNPTGIFVAGGPLPTLYPSEFAARFDFVFRGEATISFPDFCQDFSNTPNKKQFFAQMDTGKYPGIFSTRFGRIDVPVMHLTESQINEQPNPDRKGFDHERYQRQSQQKSGYKSASIMMSYGCPHHCDFCSKPIFGDLLRYRSLDKIIDEITEIVALGYNDLWIADDTFTCNENFLKLFCRRLIDADFPLSWSCLSRVDIMGEETYGLMKQSGCRKVYLGIESGNDQVLKLMNKGTNTSMIRSAVDAFTSNGLDCCGFFIIGYPGETLETIEETFAFSLSLGLNQVSFNVPYPLPGSRLYDKVKGTNGEDWTFENETRFLYESVFDTAWLQKRIKETMDAVESTARR